MSKRPPHATDCPGCPSGWVVGVLLCPLCAQRVNTAQPDIYDRWLTARGEKDRFHLAPGALATEAFLRGVIVGMAKATWKPLPKPKGARRV